MQRQFSAVIVVMCFCAALSTHFGLIVAVAPNTYFSVDVLLDYGNENRTLSTSILSTPDHDTAFNATLVAADTLNYTVSEYGVFVDAINGVWNNWTSGYWWALFFWNLTSGTWDSSSVGATDLVLNEGDMIAWAYDVHPWPPLPPVPSDVDGDGVVNILDILTCALAFGSKTGDPNWNRGADLNQDGLVDIFDLVIIAFHFGEIW